MLASPSTFNMHNMPSPGRIDEFLNLDDMASSAGIDSFLTFSRTSSSSPASSTNPLPPTPNQPDIHATIQQSAQDTVNWADNAVFQDMYRNFILPKATTDPTPSSSSSDPLAASSNAPVPFSFADLFATYGFPNSADNLFTQSPATSYPPVTPFAIDPQLVATPFQQPTPNPSPLAQPPALAPPPVASPSLKRKVEPSSVASDSEDDSDIDEDGDDLSPPPTSKGRSSTKSRKTSSSAVATGGIVKRTGPTSCVVRDADSHDPDDWRPTAEEYKKLSSKEKRQLRNKISARNFRVRRKEYITTLEGHIADRDRLIEAIRQELGASKLENNELRQEVDALKKAMLEGKAHPTGLPPPGPLPDSSSASPLSASNNVNKRRAIARPNINKDVSGSSTSNASKAFWGGAVGTGGVTPVHATLVPDMHFPSASSVLSGKYRAPVRGGLQENINPHMNFLPPSPPESPPTSIDNLNFNAIFDSVAQAHMQPSPTNSPPQQQQLHVQQQQPFDAFSDINPFTIKTLDGYRMQLWAKIAQAAAQQQQQQQYSPQSTASSSSSPSPPSSINQLPLFNQHPQSWSGALRPAFFTTSAPPTSGTKTPPPSLSAILAGKASGSSSSPSPSAAQQQQAAAASYVAAMASQSLMSRMTGAFWDAFSGGPQSSPSGSKGWDAEKVRKVLEGKAVVRIVDVDEKEKSLVKPSKIISALSSPKLVPAYRSNSDLGLEDCMRKMSLRDEAAKEMCPMSLAAASDCAAAVGVFQNLRGGMSESIAPKTAEAK